MYQYTTPIIRCRLVTKVDLDTLAALWLTIEDSAGSLTNFTLADVTIDDDEKLVTVELTQAQTGALALGDGLLQIRFLTSDGKAVSSKKSKFVIDDNLKSGVIS